MDLNVRCATYDNKEFGAVPLLESVATHNPEDGSITIFAVNRSLTDPIELTGDGMDLSGYSVREHIVLNHADLKASNTRENPYNVMPEPGGDGQIREKYLHTTLASHSWNVIRLERK